MKCTFVVWQGYDDFECKHIYTEITVHKPSFELEYEIEGYRFKFNKFLNTSYQHAYYTEV